MRRVIPHTAESFYLDPAVGSLPVWEDVGENEDHYFIGPAPRLRDPDEDVAYAKVDLGDPYYIIPGVRLAPFVLRDDIRVEIQVRFTGTWPSGTDIAFGFSDSDAILGGGFDNVYDEPVGQWLNLTLDLGHEIEPYHREAAAAGRLIAWAFTTVSPDQGYDLSMIRVTIPGVIPTRVYPRADGLGMGAPRIMDNRSPYTSARVFGMI